MMTRTPIENNIWMGYLLAAFIVIAGFAVYDILYKRVPDQALVFFIPFAALSPVLKIYFAFEQEQTSLSVGLVLLESFSGAILGIAIPLAAAAATGGSGMGGGDIKMCGVLGLIYGPGKMVLIFLVAAGLALPVALFFKQITRNAQGLSIPFLPFLACGCSMATMAELLL